MLTKIDIYNFNKSSREDHSDKNSIVLSIYTKFNKNKLK